MNRYQKTALLVGIVLIVLLGLFPPYIISDRLPNSFRSESASYGPLWKPPRGDYGAIGRLDLNRLGVEWALVVLVTGSAVFALRSKTGS